MDLGLKGKTAVVTGASRGIGRGIALELAKEGCDVALVARDASALEGLASEIRNTLGRKALVVPADLRQVEAPAAVVEAVNREFGRIDVLVNNAGATKREDFFKLTDADFEDGFALKFFGNVRLTRAAWPRLKAQHGVIINIIGLGGHTALAEFTIGGSVNAALLNFTKAMSHQGIKDGVRVNAINPGSIETDRLKGRLAVQAKAEGIDDAEARKRNLARLGVARFGLPEEIGKAVCFLASPAAAAYANGAIIDVDGGQTRHI